ncbi:zinc finger, CCHC-type, retrotransposon gag domain protein, partial [Tanacetum coccineum]
MNNPKDKAPSVRELDKAWEHVTQHVEENGKKVFICNFCSKIIRGGGINRVKKHLAGRKGDVASCTLVDPDVRFVIEGTLKETDYRSKEKASNVISDDDDDEEQDDVTLLNNKVQRGRMVKTRNGVRRSKEVAESSINTSVGPRADPLDIQEVHKGLAENELRRIIAEEVARAIQAAMPAILKQNTEITCKMIEDRIGVHKEEKQVNED